MEKTVPKITEDQKLQLMATKLQDGTTALDYVLSHPECQIEDKEFDEWCDKVIDTLEKSKEAFA